MGDIVNDVKNSVLVVDDEPLNIVALTHILNPLYTVYVSKDGTNAVSTACEVKPDVILLDVIMPGLTGFDVIATLKSKDDTKHIPVIFVTGLTNKEDEEKGLILGAADYIHKPFNPVIVKLRVSNQIRIVNQMRTIQHLSMTDALTGLANRRHFNDRLGQEWQRALRDDAPLSLLMLDVDDFKKINDNYGHLFGDSVLQSIAKTTSICLKRPMDIAARWGGEEFVVLLPNTTLDGAAIVAEHIRTAIENQEYFPYDIKDIPVTVSIGVDSATPGQDTSIHSFVLAADKALYRAKDLGKNRICLAVK